MDTPQPLAHSGAPLPKSRRNLAAMLILGGLILGAGLFGRHLLLQRVKNKVFDPSPTPHPRLNAPFITSADAVVDKMVEIAQLTADDLVYDLGCGDGRIIVTAALKSGCRGVGFDIDPDRVTEANKNVELHDVGRLVSIKEQDVFEVDLSEANAVLMYLLPWMIEKLKSQFDQMKPGSRIVSHDFYIEGVEPERIAYVDVDPSQSRHVVYLYSVPLRRNPNMPNKPPTQGVADRADAARAAAEK
ncbi:MAG TPA: methyltransferase domain-containing protein [Pirellulaceae bacterium]|jgi:SAM-dependent methyltransferase|nr:methyltransferase domain-containing protein [Pirellulaceae bacterium]